MEKENHKRVSPTMYRDINKSYKAKKDSKRIPVAKLGTSMPVAARSSFICCSTKDKLAAGLGQSVPFIEAGFQTPLVTSAVK